MMQVFLRGFLASIRVPVPSPGDRLHIISCRRCRAAMAEMDFIRQRAALLGYRQQERRQAHRKRVCAAVGGLSAVCAFAFVMFLMLGRNAQTAFAGMAEAMASVQSLHITSSVEYSPPLEMWDSGRWKRIRVVTREVWYSKPDLLRVSDSLGNWAICKGQSLWRYSRDSDRYVAVDDKDTHRLDNISSLEGLGRAYARRGAGVRIEFGGTVPAGADGEKSDVLRQTREYRSRNLVERQETTYYVNQKTRLVTRTVGKVYRNGKLRWTERAVYEYDAGTAPDIFDPTKMPVPKGVKFEDRRTPTRRIEANPRAGSHRGEDTR